MTFRDLGRLRRPRETNRDLGKIGRLQRTRETTDTKGDLQGDLWRPRETRETTKNEGDYGDLRRLERPKENRET